MRSHRIPIRHVLRGLASIAAIGLSAAGLAQDAMDRRSQTLTILVLVESAERGLANALPPPAGESLKVLKGSEVRVHGTVAPALTGKELIVTVTPPQEPEMPDPREAVEEAGEGLVLSGSVRPVPPTTLTVTVSSSGTFTTTYVTEASGGHDVLVRDISGTHVGSADFDVESPEELGKQIREALERERKALLENANALTQALVPKIRELPASPARDQALEQANALVAALEQLRSRDSTTELGRYVDALRDLQRTSPSFTATTQPLMAELRDWTAEAALANRAAPAELAALTHGNVVCDQLDVVVNGLKFVNYYLGLIIKPLDLIANWNKELQGWAKENAPMKVADLLPSEARRKQRAMEALETAWKAILGNYTEALNVKKLAVNLIGFAASRIFEQYCQTFSGPVQGTMTAVFTKNGVPWWRYRIDIAGKLVLRYPKDAAGDAIALTGEFLGNATKFKSSDNAIPVLYPGLAAGTIFKELRRIEPLTMGDLPAFYSAPAANPSVPNPIMDDIEKGGPAVQNILTPAFFRVPVRGDLRGDTIRLELQPAATDFDDARAKVKMLILPVLSMRIHYEEYALPYKGAHFILTRAMNDGPAELKVHRSGSAMYIDHRFHREREAGDTVGTYDVAVKACNPACP